MQMSCEAIEANKGNVSNVFSTVELVVHFASERELAEGSNNEDWIMPCGHDCCTCDSECK